MKIATAVVGYAGMSYAVLLAQHTKDIALANNAYLHNMNIYIANTLNLPVNKKTLCSKLHHQ